MGRRSVEERKRGTYIGGPDAAAIIGANRYATAADVYAKIVHGYEAESTPRMRRGLLVEPGLLNVAEQRRDGVVLGRDLFYVDDRVPFLRCSPDGVEPQYDRPRVLHSAKTWRPWEEEHDEKWGPTESDDVEPSAVAQVQFEMGITGARESFVHLMKMDEDVPRHYRVARDEQRIREIRQACEQFWWDHVVAKVPPPVAPYDGKAAAAMYPTSIKNKEIEPTGEIFDAAMQYYAAHAILKKAKTAKETAGAILKNALGKAEVCRWNAVAGVRPKGIVSWRSGELDPETDWESVAHEIALKFKIPGQVFHGLVKENTERMRTGRTLRVTITMPKQPKAK